MKNCIEKEFPKAGRIIREYYGRMCQLRDGEIEGFACDYRDRTAFYRMAHRMGFSIREDGIEKLGDDEWSEWFVTFRRK